MVGIPGALQARKKRRRPSDRAVRATLDTMLRASPFCHLGYVVDGEPIVAPTLCWREDDHIYLIASNAHRGLKHLPYGLSVYLTVPSNEDRRPAGFAHLHHENGRSAIVCGRAHAVGGIQSKLKVLSSLMERLSPGPSERTHRPSAAEIKATAVLRMNLDEASVKLRAQPRADGMAACGLPTWIGEIRRALRTCGHRE